MEVQHKNVLMHQGLYGFIEGSKKKPEIDDAKTKIAVWKKKRCKSFINDLFNIEG